MDGFVVGREENFSQQIKAEPEDGLGAAVVGLEDDRPMFRLPFTGRVGERKGHGQHGEKFADVNVHGGGGDSGVAGVAIGACG